MALDAIMRLGSECAARIGEMEIIMLDLAMDGVGTESTFTWGAGQLAAYPASISDDYLIMLCPEITGEHFVVNATRLAATFVIDHPNASADDVQIMIIRPRPPQ